MVDAIHRLADVAGSRTGTYYVLYTAYLRKYKPEEREVAKENAKAEMDAREAFNKASGKASRVAARKETASTSNTASSSSSTSSPARDRYSMDSSELRKLYMKLAEVRLEEQKILTTINDLEREMRHSVTDKKKQKKVQVVKENEWKLIRTNNY